MMKPIKPILAGFVLALVTLFTTGTASADLVGDSRRALQQLVAQNPAAARAKSKAVAILVFPDVVKAGFIFGAQGGEEFFSYAVDQVVATGLLPHRMVCKPVSKGMAMLCS